MYKRPRAAAQPKKKKDEHNRKRDIIVHFRMSPGAKRVGTADFVEWKKEAGLFDRKQSESKIDHYRK